MNDEQKLQSIFKNWVEEFGDDLYSWAYYKTSCQLTSEDIVQDTFLSAFKNYKGFKENSTPKTWLFSILNNKIIDHYRKNGRKKKMEYNISEKTGFEITDNLFNQNNNWKSTAIDPMWTEELSLLDNEDFRQELAGCMDQLPHKWKTSITSKYMSDKNSSEICQKLNITKSNYWQIIHRSKLLLKDCLEKNWSH